MLKSEIVELLAETYHGGVFDQPGGRDRAIALLNKQPKYVLAARLELLTCPANSPDRPAAVSQSKSAYERKQGIGRLRSGRR